VSYHVRFSFDNDARCRLWYTVKVDSSKVTLEKRADLLQRAEVRVCDFDIEITKLPFKFPDAEYDMIMMISYSGGWPRLSYCKSHSSLSYAHLLDYSLL